ncbi:MAG: PAS domain-containing sensor histidine kinase, partial [Halobacteriales archaeon]|nr:PAS domain-containing sensor histidine kinase [Halobacteriales archaeon]
VVLWNEAAAHLLGYTPDEAAKMAFENLFPDPAAQERLRAVTTQHGATLPGNEVFITPAKAKDGRHVPLEVHLCPVEDARLDGTYILAVLREVAESAEELARLRHQGRSQRAEIAELRAAGDVREEEMRVLRADGRQEPESPVEISQLVAVAAHDMFSPLTAVRLQLELLQGSMGKLSASQERSFQVMGRNVERMILLSQDILDATRLQGGKLALNLQRVDVAEAARAAGASAAPLARKKGVALECQVEEQLPVVADAQRLDQALGNLLDNAIKFTPAGGSVRLTAHRREGMARVEVVDTGAGIPAENLHRLFLPFSQATTEGLELLRGVAADEVRPASRPGARPARASRWNPP